jgi:hypothetical protein
LTPDHSRPAVKERVPPEDFFVGATPEQIFFLPKLD